MKVKIKRESFLKVFQVAAAVAPARSPKTILQNVKMEVSDKGGLLTATDMEVGVRLTIPDLEVDTAGTAVIPVQRLRPDPTRVIRRISVYRIGSG